MMEKKRAGDTAHAYVEQIKSRFAPQADPAAAGPMKKYMRDRFEFLGIKSPAVKELQKKIIKELGHPEAPYLEQVVLELWELPEREYQHVALFLLAARNKTAESDRIELLERLITNKSWWDTVDFLAGTLVGGHFQHFPEQIAPVTGRWIESDNLWLRRTAILFQLKYKQAADAERLFSYIRRCFGSKEFFINKAIGWALREYAKTDPAAVRNFVEDHTPELSPLSRREALKRIGS